MPQESDELYALRGAANDIKLGRKGWTMEMYSPQEQDILRAYHRGTQNWHRNTDAGKENVRKHNLKKYGLTPEQYREMHDSQNGLCAACGRPETANNQFGPIGLAVDHNHDTGEVRALLCMKCNRCLGMMGDDSSLLRSLADYRDLY